MFTTIITSTLFWQFVILNFINVLINTARSLTTVKGGKWIASVMNALCYGYYTVIIVITATYEMPLLLKCIAVAIVNFVGVFTIKFCEEKMQKEKVWLFNVTAKVNADKIADVIYMLSIANIKFVYNTIIKNELYTLQVFSYSIEDSENITKILDINGIKYCATEVKETNGN